MQPREAEVTKTRAAACGKRGTVHSRKSIQAFLRMCSSVGDWRESAWMDFHKDHSRLAGTRKERHAGRLTGRTP